MKKSYLTSENFSKLSTTPLKTVRLFLMVLFVCLYGNTYAQRTASVTGNWNNTATWGGSSVPASTDAVTINNGITVTITTTAVCKTLTISSGNASSNVTISGTNSLTVSGAVTIGAGTGSADNKLLNVGAGSLSCTSITVSATTNADRISGITVSTGTVNSTGNVTMGDVNDDFTFTGSGTLNVGGSFTGGTFTASTGTVNYNKAGAQSVGNYTYNNLILSGSGAKTIGTAASGTLTSGNLSIAPTGTATASITNTAIAVNTLTIGGLLTNSGTYGSTSSAATNNLSNTYFTAGVTGYVTVASDSRLTPTVTPTVGSYTYTGSAQGPNAATNTGTGTTYTYSYVGVSPTSYTASATAPTNAGTYTVTATVSANGNYVQASSSATAFSITAKALTITGLTGSNKVFDGATAANATGTAALSGVVSPDVVTLDGTATFTFASATVGTAISISTIGYTISGADAANYTLTQPTLAANITVATPTVTPTVGSYTYTGSAQGPNAATNTGTGTTYTYSYVGVSPTSYTASATAPTNAGTYTVTVTVAASGNYAQGSSSATAFSIAAKALTITGLTGTNKVYNGTTSAAATGSAALSGIVLSQTVTLGGTAIYTFASATVGTAISISTTGYSISGAAAVNYTLTQPTLSANITAKALTVTGATTTNKVYDGTNTASVTNGTLVGVISGDLADVILNQSGTFAQSTVGAPIAITSTSTISGAASANYTLTQPSLTARNITALALTITGATTTDKVYDKTTTASVTSGTLVGVLSGDVANVALTQSGTFAQNTVGTTIAITSTSTISGTKASNYTLTQPTLTARNITAIALTVTGATTSNKTYDGTNTAALTAGTLVGVVAGDTVTLTQSGTFAQSTVGTAIAITSTSTISGTNVANYTLTQPTLTARNITAKALTVTGLTGSNKVYDGATAANATGTAALSGVVSPDVVTLGGTATFTFASATVGTATSISTIGYTISGAAAANYTLIQPTLAANITVATPTVTPTVGSYTYTGSSQGPNTATNTGTGTTYTYSYAGVSPTTYTANATRPTNVGTYTVTVTVAANGNYASASSTATAFSIGTATPTVTPTIGSYTYTGSAQGPNAATNTGTGTTYTYSYAGVSPTTYTASATRPTNAGTYTVTVTVAANGNYAQGSSSATAFSIGTANPTVTPTVGSYTYIGSAQGPNAATNTGTGTTYTYSYAGVSPTTYTASATRPTNAGTYTVTVTVADNGNYSQASSSATAFSITAKALTITGLTGNDKVYNGTTAATATGSATLNGVISPDVVALGGAATFTFSSSNVGTIKSISTTGYTLSGANAGNYTFTQPTLTANITPATLTITANNGTKCAGAVYTVGSGSTAFTSNGLQNSETIGSITIASTGAVSGATAGSYSIVPSLATGGNFTAANYTITYSSGALTVNSIPTTPTIVAGGTTAFCDGGSVTLTSSALSGNQWYKDGNLISGATATTYTATTSGNYTVIMSSGTCSSSSSSTKTVTVTAIPAPIIEFTQGGNDRAVTIAACGTLVGGGQNDIDIVAGTNPGGTIQWQISSDNGATWTNAPGPTSTAAAYQLDPVYAYYESVAGVYQFRVQITNNGCTGVSIAPAIITVTGTPNLTAGTIGGDQNSCSASYTPNTFTEATAATGGSVAYTYQWQSSTDNAVFSSITGANSATYTSTALTQTTYFHRIVISGGCSAISNTITVTIGSPVTTGVTICAGGSGTLTSDIVPMDATLTTAANNTGTVSGTNWNNTNNVKLDDANFATIVVNKGTTSNVLSASNYNFNIPTNATIKGVQVGIGRSSTNTSSLKDNSVKLVVGGSIVGTNKGDTATNWPTAITAANYGSTTDLWGATLTPAIINASNFGVSLSVDNSNNNSRTASVDYMQITVTYSVPGTLDWFTTASGGTSIGSGTSFNPVGVVNSGLENTNTAGTTSYYAECSSSPGCRTKTDFIINAIPNTTSYSVTQPTLALATGSVTFTGLPASGMIYYGGTIGVAITGTTQTISGLIPSTYSFTISNGTPCTFTISSVVINAAPVITIGFNTLPTCALPSGGSVALSGLPAGNWTINPGGITGNTSSKTISGLAKGTHNYTVTDASNNVSNIVIVIPDLDTNTFNDGVWSKGIPTIDQNIILNSGTISTDISTCSCKVAANHNVVVQSGKTVTIENELTVQPNGSLTFEDGASLVQINDVVNVGNIIYQRTTSTLANNYDFVYWSSPVKDQAIGTIWMASNWADTFYNFNPAVNNWSRNAAANTMEVGKGYIARARNGQPGLDYNGISTTFIAGGKWTAKFYGVPNNGTITSSNVVKGNYCLLGNPYPSAIDASDFLSENSALLDGIIYFWTHISAIDKNTYSSNDYAALNSVGGVAAVSGGNVPTGNIAAGQGFFATATENGQITFTNEMRVAGVTNTSATNNSQFFKTTANQKTASKLEKNRIWLNLSNSQGLFKQTLVGYVTGATNGFEKAFDGETIDGNTYADFYSINDKKNLTIQGRALPFDINDTVPLGFKTTINGDFKISIAQVDGLLTNQAVYIEDKLTNTVFDLKSGDYTFTTVAGTFNDRFVLTYVNKTLSTDSFSTKKSQVLISSKNKQIKINSATDSIDKVLVYDLLGRVIYEKNNVSNTEFSISNIQSSNQTVLVKTILENGFTVTQKIIL